MSEDTEEIGFIPTWPSYAAVSKELNSYLFMNASDGTPFMMVYSDSHAMEEYLESESAKAVDTTYKIQQIDSNYDLLQCLTKAAQVLGREVHAMFDHRMPFVGHLVSYDAVVQMQFQLEELGEEHSLFCIELASSSLRFVWTAGLYQPKDFS